MNDSELLYLAINSALNAGAEILNIYNNSKIEITIKSDCSPVTQADKNADKIICEDLKKTNIPIFSEEGIHTSYEIRKNWKKFWLIDPLDGTKEFINKNGEFTVNIALIENGKPIMGIIYAPALDILYYGNLEIGAFKISNASETAWMDNVNSKSQKLPIINKNETYTVVGSRSHQCEITNKYFSKLEKEKGNINIITKGSSLKFCMVAEGVADLYPRFNSIMEWDVAAGHAIVLSSGGNMMQPTGNEFIYNKENLRTPHFIASKKQF